MLVLARRFFGRFRLSFALGPLCKLVEVCFDLCTPVIIARMIDEGVLRHDLSRVAVYGCVMGLFALLGMGFALVCQKMASRASQGVGTQIRRALYAHIGELSFAELDRFGTPSLITRITSDVNQVQLAVALAIRQLVRWPFLAVGSIAAALLIDAQLGLVFLVSTPIVGAVFWFVMARCVPYFKELQARLDRIGLLTREGLSGVRVVRAFVREARERTRFREAADAQAAVAIAVGKLSSALNPVTFLVMNLAVCCILWMGGGAVEVGRLTQGEVMAFVNYMTQTLLSIVYVANLVVVFTRASASAGRINEVLDCAPSIVGEGNASVELPDPVSPGEKPGHAPVEPLAGGGVPALRMEGASFAYPGAAADAVHGATFALMPGQTLGVIGGTGSGKSSLVSLVPRLYDVHGGSVEVFGTDVRDWPLDQLRHVVGLVPQKASLVSGALRDNLCWRKEGATDGELWRALEIAQAADFVRALPDGLDAPVEAGGRNFSGGQRQRLTIARALVGDPRLLILDDAASALDFKTDAALRRAIAGLGATTVVVSQRVSSVRGADLIAVVRRGSVVGLGTHEELLRSCPVYMEICQSQLGASGDGPISPGEHSGHRDDEPISPGEESGPGPVPPDGEGVSDRG